MSKPVSNVEIEDVLASIRRLVADDGRNASVRTAESLPDGDAQPQGANGATPMRPATEGRLILTPAQRVPEAEVAAEETEDEDSADLQDSPEPVAVAEADEEVEAQDSPHLLTEAFAVEVLRQDLSDNAPQAGAGLADIEAEAEVEDGEAAPEDAASLDDILAETDAMLARVISEEVGAALDPAVDREDASEEAGAEISASHADTLDDETGAAEADPDGGPLDAALSAAVRNAAAEEASEGDADAGKPAPTFFTTRHPQAAPRAGLSLEEKIAELEAMIGHSEEAGDWEDDTGADTGNANAGFASTLEWEDSPSPDTAIFQSRRMTELAEMAEDLDVAEEDRYHTSATLDDAALRALVVDIVRSELQGSLGERITRNVRKLVRREIQRALTSQNYD